MPSVGRPKGTPKTGGREKGTKNTVNRILKDQILGALGAVGGQQYLEKQARDNPGAFMTLLGKVLPTTLTSDPDEPIIARIESIIVSPKNTDSSHIRTAIETE
jgi:hypothetical protein